MAKQNIKLSELPEEITEDGLKIYGSASYELVVDKETGITLKWAASGTSYVDGESGAASFEVTSFKTGDGVVVPSIKAEA